jgi:hypothetical protein
LDLLSPVGLSPTGLCALDWTRQWTIENGIKGLIDNYFFNNIPGIDPHRINIHYFVVKLARILYEMFCQDYEDARNPDGSKKTIDTLRTEFMTGSSASLSLIKDELIHTWVDPYPERQHHALEAPLGKLNEESKQGFPFLGSLGLRFEMTPLRFKKLRNIFKREAYEF